MAWEAGYQWQCSGPMGSKYKALRGACNVLLDTCLRPLQFNYLSYELFFGKNILSDSKKKKRKKSTLVSYGQKKC